jgi:hypothetical protein
MAEHLVGVFNTKTGGCIAECGECGDKISAGNEGRVKNRMSSHYKKKHPEHTVKFKRYDWNRS